MPGSIRSRKKNKRRRLAASANAHHNVDVNSSSSHGRVIDSSGELTASPDHGRVINSFGELAASPNHGRVIDISGKLTAFQNHCRIFDTCAGPLASPGHVQHDHCSSELTASTTEGVVVSKVTNLSARIPSETLTYGTLSCGELSFGTLSFEIGNPSERRYSDDIGNTEKSNMADIISVISSDELLCHRADDGLFSAINSESSSETMSILIRCNTVTQDGLKQALISVCRRGHKHLVRTLVRVGANIEHPDENGNTPLLICAENGFTDIVQFLVSKHANIKAVNSVGNTVLILSKRSAGSTDLTRFLLEQDGIHHQNQHWHRTLHMVTYFMDVDTMRLLLEKSMTRNTHKGYLNNNVFKYEADSCFTNRRSDDDKQEVIASRSEHSDVCAFLKDYVFTGTSPLELAIKVGDITSLDMFLDSSSDKKRYVDSALMYMFTVSRQSNSIIRSTEKKIIQRLLEYGADVNQGHEPILLSRAVESGDFQLVELLCTHGAHVTTHSYSREQDPLCIAAKTGRQDLIELLLKYQADINRVGFFDSALDYALRNNHIECAKLLIQCGAKMEVKYALSAAVDHQTTDYMHFLFDNYKPDIMDHFLQSPHIARGLLIYAVKNGNCDIIGQILDAGVGVNEVDSDGQTPLKASTSGEVAQFLIQRGADVNQATTGRNGLETPLIHMIHHKKCTDTSTVEYCQILIDHGASVNCRSGEGKTPLMMAACQGGCVNMLQMLLDSGADVNDKDNNGETALMLAIQMKYSENVYCLIDNGASVNCRSGEGKTPLMMAASHRESVGMLQMLLNNGASVNCRSGEGKTPLIMAHSKRESVDMLLDKDTNGDTALIHAINEYCPENVCCLIDSVRDKKSVINVHNNDGLTPLMVSVIKRNIRIMNKLIEEGADVNMKDYQEKTALHHHLISSFWHHDMLECLLKAGSNVNCQNSGGLTPLMLAARKSTVSLMTPLLDAGADVNAVNKYNHSQTALSCLSHSVDVYRGTVLCIEMLLDRGVSSSYLRHECLIGLIIYSLIKVIPKLIQRGLGPADVEANILPRSIITSSDVLTSTVSPLWVALLCGQIPLARYFVDILFLTSSDLSMFACNKAMECLLKKRNRKKSLHFLQELSSQPMSLVHLSLVAVSSAVGPSPGRETRVNSLPLPQMIKDRLLFKSADDNLSLLIDHGDTGYIRPDSVDDEDDDNDDDDDDFYSSSSDSDDDVY